MKILHYENRDAEPLLVHNCVDLFECMQKIAYIFEIEVEVIAEEDETFLIYKMDKIRRECCVIEYEITGKEGQIYPLNMRIDLATIITIEKYTELYFSAIKNISIRIFSDFADSFLYCAEISKEVAKIRKIDNLGLFSGLSDN